MWAYRVGRLMRRFSYGRNPVSRRSDRIESRLSLGAVALVIAAVPFAGQADTAFYEAGIRAAAQKMATSLWTEAISQEAAPRPPLQASRGPVVQRPKVRVAWRVPGGVIREGVIEVDYGTPAGTRIPVWTDRTGALVDAPMTPLNIKSTAVVVGWALVVGWAVLLAIVLAIVHKVLEHFRLVAWGTEWEQVERDWRRPTG